MNLDAKGYIFCKYQNDHKISSAVMKNTYTFICMQGDFYMIYSTQDFFFKVWMCGIMYKCAKYSPLVSLAHFHTEIYEVIFFKEENACSLDVYTIHT